MDAADWPAVERIFAAGIAAARPPSRSSHADLGRPSTPAGCPSRRWSPSTRRTAVMGWVAASAVSPRRGVSRSQSTHSRLRASAMRDGPATAGRAAARPRSSTPTDAAGARRSSPRIFRRTREPRACTNVPASARRATRADRTIAATAPTPRSGATRVLDRPRRRRRGTAERGPQGRIDSDLWMRRCGRSQLPARRPDPDAHPRCIRGARTVARWSAASPTSSGCGSRR